MLLLRLFCWLLTLWRSPGVSLPPFAERSAWISDLTPASRFSRFAVFARIELAALDAVTDTLLLTCFSTRPLRCCQSYLSPHCVYRCKSACSGSGVARSPSSASAAVNLPPLALLIGANFAIDGAFFVLQVRTFRAGSTDQTSRPAPMRCC